MISICTSIYRETDNLEIFVRSLFGNATSPEMIDLIVVNDENYPSTTAKLNELKKEFPQIKIVPHTREERVKFIKNMIDYYKKEKIFDKKYIKEMRKTLRDYKSGKQDRLWLSMVPKYNMAAKEAKSDILVFMPADYLVFFDMSSFYMKCSLILEDKKICYGHFDWVDLSALDPTEILSNLRKCKTTDEFKAYTQSILFKGHPVPVQAQHGSRVVNKTLYESVGKFDERWFTRALGDDLFNDKCRAEWGVPYRLLDYSLFLRDPMFIGAVRANNGNHTYLTPSYTLSVDDHLLFVNKIKEYLCR